MIQVRRTLEVRRTSMATRKFLTTIKNLSEKATEEKENSEK